MDSQGLLMHAGIKDWPVWAKPTDKQFFHILLKKLMLVAIERSQIPQYNFLGSSGAQALTGQGFFGSKRMANTVLGRWS